MLHSSPERASGFTLVEVLVALGVVALVMPALMLVIRERADSVAYLRDQTLAQWVAANQLAEIRLRGLAATDRNGTTEMAGRRWYWRFGTSNTGVDGFLRVDVEVGADDEPSADGEFEPVAVLTGFVRERTGASASGSSG